MCGILFCKKQENPEFKDIFKKALMLMDHRGPDNNAIFFGDNYALGHTRLAIIDLSHDADQPFWDKDKRFVLVFNGEIYNYKELREKLVHNGCIFRTQSDTEVFLEYIISFGMNAALMDAKGMFAFVFYDTVTGKFEAVRDHFGQKPLYYCEDNGVYAIASSIRSLLMLKEKIEPDLNSYRIYLCTRGIIPADDTFFKGIKCLPAGHRLICDGSSVKVEEYFNTWSMFDEDIAFKYSQMNVDSLLEPLEGLLRQSISRHMVSDVPIGVLLSGGIDSSLVYWFLHDTGVEITSLTKLCPDIENIPLAVVPKILSQKPANSIFNMEKPEYYLSGLVDFVFSSHAPSRWGGGPPMNRLCQVARQNGIYVLLGGEGTDEYFSGYKEQEAVFKNFDGNMYAFDQVVGINSNSLFYSDTACRKYIEYNHDVRKNILSRLACIQSKSERFKQATLLHDTSVFLQSCSLLHSDAYSMMASVELRNPMLDIDLVRFVCNLPMSMKFASSKGGHMNKYLLRELALRRVGSFIDVPKEGTRNYSMKISEPAYWKFSNFFIKDIIPLSGSMEKKDIFKVINLELFHRLFFKKEKNPLSGMLTSKGLNDLLARDNFFKKEAVA